MLTFPYFMLWQPVQKEAYKIMAEKLNKPLRQIKHAVKLAEIAQANFYCQLRQRGQAVLMGLEAGQTAVVIVGRPYNAGDPGASQDLPYKLRKLGVLPIPMDFLPLESADISAYHDNMFWRSGQDILAAATIIRDDPRLQTIYLTNFGCGPDSFILTFFSQILGDKPFLELEIDDHTADAGVITRCEAFLESLQMSQGVMQRS
jgi:predicted nucleotide-binding protein (sugar kinase/HSP70/actin superfamily)